MKPKRVLLKLSGEALAGNQGFGVSPDVVSSLANDIVEVHSLGIQIGIVIGGGNIFRGLAASARGMDRVAGDHIGMLATVINALALQDALEKKGVLTRVQTAIQMEEFAEPFIRRRAIRHLEKGRIVIFGAGTGNPYFTTDTAAALRSVEIEADLILKGTKVNGIYSSDPLKDSNATMYQELSYLEVIQKKLRVMDTTAISLCMDNNIPIIVFNMTVKGNFKRLMQGKKLGTKVYNTKALTNGH